MASCFLIKHDCHGARALALLSLKKLGKRIEVKENGEIRSKPQTLQDKGTNMGGGFPSVVGCLYIWLWLESPGRPPSNSSPGLWKEPFLYEYPEVAQG
jgi:hypothetical protein